MQYGIWYRTVYMVLYRTVLYNYMVQNGTVIYCTVCGTVHGKVPICGTVLVKRMGDYVYNPFQNFFCCMGQLFTL